MCGGLAVRVEAQLLANLRIKLPEIIGSQETGLIWNNFRSDTRLVTSDKLLAANAVDDTWG